MRSSHRAEEGMDRELACGASGRNVGGDLSAGLPLVTFDLDDRQGIWTDAQGGIRDGQSSNSWAGRCSG
jgi:hypothetical protein